MIQDAEIGYAVLYCCTERHCNPDFDVGKGLFREMQKMFTLPVHLVHTVFKIISTASLSLQ